MSPWVVILAVVIAGLLMAAAMVTTGRWLFLVGAVILGVVAVLGMRGGGAPKP